MVEVGVNVRVVGLREGVEVREGGAVERGEGFDISLEGTTMPANVLCEFVENKQ